MNILTNIITFLNKGLIEAYPEFREIYKEGYEICLNVERVMEMFSKELYEQNIINTVKILRELNIPEQEIVTRVFDQYQIDEELYKNIKK